MKTLRLAIIALLIVIGICNIVSAQPLSSGIIPTSNNTAFSMNFSKGVYSAGETIEISGTAIMNTTAVVSLVNNHGTLVNSTRVLVDKNGKFTADFIVPKDAGTSMWQVVLSDNLEQERTSIIINSANQTTPTYSSGGATFSFFSSPLKQFDSGIAVKNVVCTSGFTLVIKAEDSSPACVKPETAQQLIKRGWASEIISTNASSGTPTQNPINLGSSNIQTSGCDNQYNPQTTNESPLFPNGTHTITDYTPIFYMPMNSTGKICVHYSNPNPPRQVGIRIFEANNLAKNASTISTSSSQNTIPTGNTTVMYTIKTGDKTGFYGISLFCGGQAFAVGYDNQSRIVLDDFPWYGKAIHCPIQSYEYEITGVQNIGIYYIKSISHEQLLYEITNTTVTSVHLTPTSQNVKFSLQVRSFDKPVDFVFDYKDSIIEEFKTNPGFEKSFDVCNWNVANRDLVGSFPWLRLGQILVNDNPVTIKPWSNYTYTFSITAKGLDVGYYGLNPVVYGRPAGIIDENAGLNYIAYDYPVTIGLGSNMDQTGVCGR